ncbi:MAG: hypothetical protein ACRCSV_04695 [Chlamydiales bacterium]
MIKFSTVIDNFDRVYKAKAQKEENLFLNSSLEVIESPSEKATFSDIMFALQFRKWDASLDNLNPSQIARSIKKISLQAKLIYDNDPFPAKLPCKYVELLHKSICEGSFLDQAKLEEYTEEIRKYCEMLYFYKLLIEAEENLVRLSDSDNLKLPPNLEEFNKFAEDLYHKILVLVQTKEFSFLTKAKYSNPLLYLSVFIEVDEKNIQKTYPEILNILQLAELTYSKKQLNPTKTTFTANQLREKFLSILSNPTSSKIKQKNFKDKFFFMAGYSQSISPSFNNINQYKDELKLKISDFEKAIAQYEKGLKLGQNSINVSTEYKIDFSNDVHLLKLCLKQMKNYLNKDCIPMLCFQQLPFLKTQHAYIKSFKKLITMLKIEKLSSSNNSSVKRKDRINKEDARKKMIFPLEFSAIEQKTVQEHFPTLIQEQNWTDSQEKISSLKKEVIDAEKIYALLMLELSKVQSVNSSLKEKTSTISSNYIDLLTLLSGNENPSLPSAEKFNQIGIPECLTPLFSNKEIKHIDKLIVNFQKKTVQNLQTKIKEYSEEYLRLQSNKKVPIKRPKAISKDSFVASTSSRKDKPVEPLTVDVTKEKPIEVSSGAIQKTKITKPEVTVISAEEKEDIVPDQEEIKPSLTPTEEASMEENIDNVDKVDLEMKKKKKATSKSKVFHRSVSHESPKILADVIQINSLKMLPSVTVRQKIPAIFYHEHVNRWFTYADEAVDDPKYAGFNVTNQEKKERIAYHAFPQLMDSLLETNYSLKKIEIDPKHGYITRYGIPGTIVLNTKKHYGIFEYTINARHICFHRCFSRKTDNFEKTKPSTVSTDSQQQTKIEHFYFGKTPVELNTRREIAITDYKTNAEFTIVHPDDYWKLPTK